MLNGSWKIEILSGELHWTKPDGRPVPRSSSKEFTVVKERSGMENVRAKAEKHAILLSRCSNAFDKIKYSKAEFSHVYSE
jgi:hypothetical protein